VCPFWGNPDADAGAHGHDRLVRDLGVDVVDKAVAYVVHRGRIAVFVHADDEDPLTESGLQVPAGSIAPGESAVDAALREAYEESGLDGLRVVAELGIEDYDMRPYADTVHRRHFVQLGLDVEPPQTWTHVEEHSDDGVRREFRFFWLDLPRAHALAAGHGALLALVRPERG
jgi:8-oxo-dGTP pyrophosphatase MutT (NUDIX family)